MLVSAKIALWLQAVILSFFLMGCVSQGSYPAPVLGVTVNKDLIVLDVYKGQAGEQAGIQVQDKLLTLNGNSLETPEEWWIEISKLEADELYEVVLERDGKKLAFTVTALRPTIREPGPTPTLIPTDQFSFH